MQYRFKRLLALLLALLMLATAPLGAGALAEAQDWQALLRELYGQMEDAGDPTAGEAEDGFELPVTEPQQIVNYLDRYGELPENFITKKEAIELGWDSSYNYVGDVAPGMSLGGDRFGNYEGQLPRKKGRQWYECDCNYTGRRRNAERLLFSSDGLYYYTDDHYKTFTQMFPEDSP